MLIKLLLKLLIKFLILSIINLLCISLAILILNKAYIIPIYKKKIILKA